jgi:hypothetical protein
MEGFASSLGIESQGGLSYELERFKKSAKNFWKPWDG